MKPWMRLGVIIPLVIFSIFSLFVSFVPVTSGERFNWILNSLANLSIEIIGLLIALWVDDFFDMQREQEYGKKVTEEIQKANMKLETKLNTITSGINALKTEPVKLDIELINDDLRLQLSALQQEITDLKTMLNLSVNLRQHLDKGEIQ